MTGTRRSREVQNRTSARLRAVGQRVTPNRRAVMDVLADAGQPLSMPEILRIRGSLAQSTVYRTLAVLERAGIVRRVRAEGDFARYELAEDLTEHHHHLICASCGTIEDIAVPVRLERTVDDAVAELAEARGFEARGHRLDVLGLCPRCA